MFKKILSLFVVLFIISAIAGSVYADQTVFGPKDLKIKRWHFHFSSHRFKVNDPAEGVLTIIKNTPGKKIRGGFCYVNGKYIRLRSFLKGKGNIFEKEVKLRSRNRVFVFLRGSRRASVRVEVRKKGTNHSPEVSLTANPTSIYGSQSSTLSWTSNFADTCKIEPGLGKVDLNGSATVSPTETTTYTIIATGSGGTVTANATVTLANTAPVANDQTVTLNEGEATSIALTASDANGDAMTYQVVTGPSHGTLTGQAPNLTYTPSQNYNGSDTFTFKAYDGSLDSNTATISLTIQPINDVPIAVNDTTTTHEDTPITAIAVLTNDTDTDGDILSISDFTQPAHGTAGSNGNGTLTYSPDLNYNGTDSFTYTISDGNGGTDTASVNITINTVNDAPVANDQTVTLNEDESVSITLTASDVDGDALTYQIGSNPSHGKLTGYVPNFTYTPAENYNGIDAFTFRTNDGTVNSGDATVAITVNPVNDPPVANAGPDQNGLQGDVITLDGSGSNDIDENNLTYNWTFISVPTDSTAIFSDSSIVNPNFTPDMIGTYEIRLIVNDGMVNSAADTVIVNILASPTVEISALPETILSGEFSILAWTSTNADSCVIEPNVPNTALNGSTMVYPAETTTYTITATNAGGTATASVTVNVIVLPSVNFNASPETIAQDGSSVLSWTSENTQSAHIDNGIGAVGPNSLNEPVTVNPEHTTTYTISVTGPTGNASAKATIKVTGNPAPQPDGSFGQQYEDLVPPDSTVDEHDPWRFSLITGMVHAIDGSPMQDVSITIHSHPEYGTVTTDTSGRFSIPVEGGGTMTVVYQKGGVITAHRKVYVPWNDIAIAENIQMIAQDLLSTTIVFGGSPDTVVTHQSSKVTDEFGSRSCSMVFTGDNSAWLVDENGNNVHQLETINVRATEFTTLNSMPAVLPPNSAYTYSTELAVDGAARVRFEKPVITWVENFLGFDVGEIVPAGYYDRDQGVWVPFDNGVVVRLLDTNSDGIVDALDANGDGTADDLNNDGSFNDEVMGLEDAGKYSPDTTFWRVAVNHFAPWDYNWPFIPPGDATASKAEGKAIVDQQGHHEDISIPGTDITLHYASNRVEGYQTVIHVPVSGDTVPASLKRIEVRVKVAGLSIEQVLDPLPNQAAGIEWNGLDHLGRRAQGPIFAHVKIGFVYDAIYLGAENDFQRSFAQTGNETPTGIPTRQEVIYWKNDKIQVLLAKEMNTIADGWTLSAHHKLHPVDPTALYKGDGTTIRNNASIIDTVAGIGNYGYSGDGGPAAEAALNLPWDVAVDLKGNYYIADRMNRCIRKVDTSGIITTVAGNGISGYSGDGGPATEAQLSTLYGIAVDNEGNLYISDEANLRVRKVDTNGIITTVAGNGNPGYSGDNGPATEATLDSLRNITTDNEGNLYIVDSPRIRKVDTSGIITTVAGNGTSTDDGVPAIEAQLSDPMGVTVDSFGNLYITDWALHSIRKINTSGIITTIAGNNGWGSGGDGGPATLAELALPTGITTDSTGNLYFTDTYNFLIRKIDTHGIITSVAGVEGVYGYSGDGGPAREAELSMTWGIALDSQDSIYIATGDTIRKVAPQFFIDRYSADGGDVLFAEENNLSHTMSSSGQHIHTVVLDTGATLHEFGYDADNQLISITDDQFGNISINRDADGVPISVVSPDGITTLAIDDRNHLAEITYPDGSFYSFEYTPDGLMTDKIDP